MVIQGRQGPDVEETLVPDAVISEIARRHGLTLQHVFTERRQARRLPTPTADDPPFVPTVVDALAPVVVCWHERKTARRKANPDVGSIEIEAEGVTIRASRGVDVAIIAAIVHAAEGEPVIGPSGTVRVVTIKPVDFRKGMERVYHVSTRAQEGRSVLGCCLCLPS